MSATEADQNRGAALARDRQADFKSAVVLDRKTKYGLQTGVGARAAEDHFAEKGVVMQMKPFVRSLSLGTAAIAFLATGTAWALPPTHTAQSSQQMSSSWLTGATARLDHTLDAKDAKQGMAVEAKLDHTVKTPDGTKLPAGTELRGTVASVQAADNGPSSISLRFDKAELKNGQTVPVKVTLIGAYPSNENQMSSYGQLDMAPAPRRVSPKAKYEQEAGTLSHIAMNSRVSGQNSATFLSKDGDVKLRAGTFLQLGIALQGGGMNSGA